MTSFLFTWMARTPVSAWVNSSIYIWPTLESLHFLSLCVLMGSLLVIDLRLIGAYRDRCAALMPSMIRLSLAAFLMNLATGLLFISGNTFKYIDNPAMEWKLVLIIAAGINALVYRLKLHWIVSTSEVTTFSRTVGWLSLLLWSGVIVCGRMLTYYAVHTTR